MSETREIPTEEQVAAMDLLMEQKRDYDEAQRGAQDALLRLGGWMQPEYEETGG